VVVDGPLSAQHKIRRAVGYVKTHHVSYLDREASRVVEALGPCQRTPLFLTTTSWSRYSCYLRLPGPRAHPWADVARIEISTDVELAEAVSLSDRATATLPRFASAAHKEPRAPQNLYPIGGLERELRHRLGDSRFIHRALRMAAASFG
jgi:hypothetical protein